MQDLLEMGDCLLNKETILLLQTMRYSNVCHEISSEYQEITPVLQNIFVYSCLVYSCSHQI